MSGRGSHTSAIPRETKRALRSRRRRRRMVRTGIRTLFWALVLGGVFVLGLGVGRQLGHDPKLASGTVSIVRSVPAVTATLPTQTVTVAVTPTKPASTPAAVRKKAGKR